MNDANWGMGVGGSIAVGLMIFSLVLLILEVRKFCQEEPPPPRPEPPPPPYSKSLKILFSSYISSALAAAVRVPIVHVPDPVVRPNPPIIVPLVRATCLLPCSKEYLRSLNLDLFFEQRCDCYCRNCRPNDSRKTNVRGGYPYTIPYGWVRFRIKTEQVHIQEKHIFQQWATTYYGIWEENLERILRNRFIPFPGDELLDRIKFKDHSRDGQHCFTSPSINYTSDWQRSPTKRFTLLDGTVYNVQMTLQCKQKPDTFIVQPGRPGLCNIISADEIEWKSNQRATIIPIGLMIRMTKA
jgi:hypothetical protein